MTCIKTIIAAIVIYGIFILATPFVFIVCCLIGKPRNIIDYFRFVFKPDRSEL